MPKSTLDKTTHTKPLQTNGLECLNKPYVKLNLGSGNKYYDPEEGWINVDAVTPKSGLVDLVTDVREINKVIGPNVADEIHAYHLIEHFFKVEVPIVLTNWLDTLKPGGKLVMETPCVLKSAVNILQMVTTKDKKVYEDLGIKAFFGDVDVSNPQTISYDLHKWLWSPQTLGEEMEKVGFVKVREEDPLTHMKGLRDFRIVGEKP